MKRYPSAIVATQVVPWDEHYEFEENRFRRGVRKHVEHLTRHVYIFGTAGEGYAVNEQQFDEISTVFFDEMQKCGGRAMLGVISLSQTTIVDRIARGREMGYREFQISLPSWGPLEDKEVDNFFDGTCGRFPDCQFLHYNNPRTKRALDADAYARLARRHPNLVAVKTGGASSDDELQELITKAPDLQFYPGKAGFAGIRDEHECGLLISLGSANHANARRFFNARGEDLASLSRELDGIGEALFNSIDDGVKYVDGAYDKMLYKLHDPDFPLRLLPPYESTTDEMFENFRRNIPRNWLPDG